MLSNTHTHTAVHLVTSATKFDYKTKYNTTHTLVCWMVCTYFGGFKPPKNSKFS